MPPDDSSPAEQLGETIIEAVRDAIPPPSPPPIVVTDDTDDANIEERLGDAEEGISECHDEVNETRQDIHALETLTATQQATLTAQAAEIVGLREMVTKMNDQINPPSPPPPPPLADGANPSPGSTGSTGTAEQISPSPGVTGESGNGDGPPALPAPRKHRLI